MRDIVAEYVTPTEQLPKGNGSRIATTPLSSARVPGGRNTTFYTAHSYHTKVPPEAITPFIRHFTEPGDVILDPFSGSGMTGVAAAMTGRRSILNDLSPAAVHLSWNHTNPCDPDSLAEAFENLAQRVGSEIKELYATRGADGRAATINWVMWSTKHACPTCCKKFLLWDAIDRTSGRLGSHITCPKCSALISRRSLISIGSEPAWICYRTREGGLLQRAATRRDVRDAHKFTRSSINDWYPTVQLGADREMYVRCALQLRDINDTADLYTARNLKALATIWREIGKIPDQRLRLAMVFAFTNTAWHGTRMRRFNARGGQRPLTGTLYIPQLSAEANVLEVLRNKIRQLTKYYAAYQPTAKLPAILNESATDLSQIDDSSIDYVFTDPPFGSNIFYGDCNLIWESWLGRITDVAKEAVINRSISGREGAKSLDDYQGLMSSAMSEIGRVLKPGGWATIVFHNTNAEVWAALQRSAQSAGFEFHDASSLDRKQQSHKGYKGRNGAENVAHFDVIMNLRKLERPAQKLRPRRSAVESLDDMLQEIAQDPVIANHGLQAAHAEVMRRLASTGQTDYYSYSEVKSAWDRCSKRVKS